jgi:hypothetical protein
MKFRVKRGQVPRRKVRSQRARSVIRTFNDLPRHRFGSDRGSVEYPRQHSSHGQYARVRRRPLSVSKLGFT